MKYIQVFAYGSNMSPIKLTSKNINPVMIKLARLDHYDYNWHYYSGYTWKAGACNIEAKENSCIYGVVMEITQDELKVFDRLEGFNISRSFDQNSYNRKSLEVSTLTEKTFEPISKVPCYVYISSEGNRNYKPEKIYLPSEDYKKQVLEGALYHDLPDEAIKKIKNWITKEEKGLRYE